MISGHDTNAISLNKKIHLIFFNNISFLPPPPTTFPTKWTSYVYDVIN